MKETRIKLAVGGNRGFTLVELLVAIAIGSVIVGAATMSIASIMKITPLNNDRAVVLRQVQNAGHWVSLDVLGASSVTPQPQSGVLVRLQQRSHPAVTRTVEYVLVAEGDVTKLFRRVDGATPGMLIAEHVVVADTSFAARGSNAYRLTIKVSRGTATLRKTYDITQRSAN